MQFGWFLNPSWQTRHCNPDTLDLHGHCPLVLLQTKLVEPVPSQLQAIKEKKLKFCYFFVKEILLLLFSQLGNPKWKSKHSSHFNPPMPHLQWHWPLASHPLVELVIDPSGLQLQSSRILDKVPVNRKKVVKTTKFMLISWGLIKLWNIDLNLTVQETSKLNLYFIEWKTRSCQSIGNLWGVTI